MGIAAKWLFYVAKVVGIVKEQKERKVESYDVTDYRNLTGKGLTANVNGSVIAVIK